MTTSEDEFHEAMIRGPHQLRALGYTPTRFIQMVAEFGGLGAAHALLSGPVASARHECRGKRAPPVVSRFVYLGGADERPTETGSPWVRCRRIFGECKAVSA
jgi:hypothetical protein